MKIIKEKNSRDYKLIDHKKFLKFFDINSDKVQILYEMIPQYTFKFLDKLQLEKFVNKIKNVGSDPSAMRFGYYVPSGRKIKNTQGFFLSFRHKRRSNNLYNDCETR